MLVLTRRLGETIVINGNVQVTVVAVQGERVRLGVTAPWSVSIDRQEVHQRRLEFFQEPDMTQPVGVA
jgi:carbon storage regulator